MFLKMASEPHVEIQNSNNEIEEKPKRRLEKTMLDNFGSVINPNEKIRVKGSLNILKHLVENNDADNQDEIKYALGRIIRGLGSSNVNARTGFYTALTALINIRDDLTVDDIFENINKQLHKAGSNSKGENADIFVGQILACGAIMRSNLWTKSSETNREKNIELMLKAGKERSYLRLLVYIFIVDKLQQLNVNQFESMFLLIKDEFFKPWNEQTLDSLYLLISIKNIHPHVVQKKILGESLGFDGVTSLESLEELCKILMAIPRLTALNHPVYDAIGKDIAKSEFLLEFLNQLDKHLLRPNRNKHLLMVKIVSVILENLADKNDIPKLLSKNFIRQTINYFKSFNNKEKDVEFQNSIHSFFKKLVDISSTENSILKIDILRKLLFYPGTFIFEKVTRSKVVQQITGNLDYDGVQKLAKVYRGVVEGTEIIDSEYTLNSTWLNNDRLYAAHLLIKLLNHSTVKSEINWKIKELSFLMNLALLKDSNGINIGSELAVTLKAAFFGALDLKHTRQEDQQKILLELVHKIELTPENLETVFRNPITKEQYEIWQKTRDVIRRLRKHTLQGLSTVFLTLFLHLTLQLFNDPKLASDSLNELFICYKKTKKDRHHNKSADITNLDQTVSEKNEVKEPLWIEVVTDLFLNLLSHNYHLLRSLIKLVFPYLCKYMTSSAVHQILTVLDPKNEDNPLSKNSEETDDESEDGSNEKEEDDKDDESENEFDNEFVDETPNEKLRLALHQVLVSNEYQTEEESIDLDQLSDTEGEKLNAALAETFKQFKPNLGRSKRQSKEQQALTHFRIRVLDLIEIYLDSTPSMLLTLEIMLPLLQAVEFSIRDEHQKPLNDRLRSSLKKLSAVKNFSSCEGVDDTVLCELLRSLLEKGTKNFMIIQDMGVQISDCCVLVIRCSNWLRNIENTPKNTRKLLKKRIAEIISGELHNYFHKRDSLIPYVLFKNTIQLSWDGTLTVVPLLLEYVFKDEIKPFKKTQATELLKLFYTNQRYLTINPGKIKEKLLNHHSTFFENVIALFNTLCENPSHSHIKEKFICNLLQLLSAMKNCCLNIENIIWPEIGKSVKEYRSYVSFSKDAKLAFNKFCSHIGVSNVTKMKQKTVNTNNLPDKVESNYDLKEKKGNRKTKNKEKLKLKKEAKELRLKSLSEGFGRLDFTSTTSITSKESDDEETNLHASNNILDGKKRKKNKKNETTEDIRIERNGNDKETDESKMNYLEEFVTGSSSKRKKNIFVSVSHNNEKSKKSKVDDFVRKNRSDTQEHTYENNNLEQNERALNNKKRKKNKNEANNEILEKESNDVNITNNLQPSSIDGRKRKKNKIM